MATWSILAECRAKFTTNGRVARFCPDCRPEAIAERSKRQVAAPIQAVRRIRSGGAAVKHPYRRALPIERIEALAVGDRLINGITEGAGDRDTDTTQPEF